jgi:SNF2 family DNA or RNA helicase
VPEQDYDVLVLSYDHVSKLKEELKRQAFRVVVCDESHCIKNHTSERSKNTVPLVQVGRGPGLPAAGGLGPLPSCCSG